jgi:hypothetical protein
MHGHWAGNEIADRLAKALARSLCWNNPPYLARIIAQKFFASLDETLGGFGMSPCLCGNDRHMLVVDMSGMVREVAGDDPAGQAVREWTFREFVDSRRYRLASMRD